MTDDEKEIYELTIYGQAMHRIKPDGSKEFIPREEWNIQHKELMKEQS